MKDCLRPALLTIENFACDRPGLFSSIGVAVLFGMVFLLLVQSYQTNDDVQMSMIVSGTAIACSPDEHLIFSNVLIGHLLKSLYTLRPGWPWYGIYLYTIHYLAQVAILYAAIAAGYSRSRLGLYLMYFGAVELYFLNNLQFTTTASCAAQSGIMLLLIALEQQTLSAQHGRLWMLLAAVAMLAVASLVRLECFCMMAVLALPAVLGLAVQPPYRQRIRTLSIVGLISLPAIAGMAFYDRHYLARDPAWRDFHAFNKLRAAVNDYEWLSYTPQTAPLFNEVHWSENDFATMRNWCYDDPILYSKERLGRLIDCHPWQAERVTPKYCWSTVRRILKDKSLWPPLLVTCFLALVVPRDKHREAAMFATWVIALAMLGYVAITKKPPPNRVYMPVLTFPTLLLLGSACAGGVRIERIESRQSRPSNSGFRPVLTWVLLFIALGGIAYGIGRQVRDGHKVRIARDELHASFARLPRAEGRLYVFWAPCFPFQVLSPLDNLQAFANLRLLNICWPQRTPINEAVKRQFAVENTYRALFERPELCFLGDRKCIALYRKFVNEHFGCDVRFTTFFDGGHSYDLAGRFQIDGTATNEHSKSRFRTTLPPPAAATRR